MLTHLIPIGLISLGIILSTTFFLRSSFLKRQHAKKMEEIQKYMETGLIMLGHKMDVTERHIQDVTVDIKDINIRTTIVETRLEERNASLLVNQGIVPTSTTGRKRGRPRKNPEK